jgi:hypothetical protein
MKTTFSRLATVALPGLFALLVIFAATAEAGGKSPDAMNTTAMGQSIREQLSGTSYQFAIAKSGVLVLTGEQGHTAPTAAVDELRNGVLGGDAAMCHLSDNGVEVVVLLDDPAESTTQPCGIVGEAFDAA